MVYAMTQQLVQTFQDQFHTTKCTELLQLQLGTPEASSEYQERGLHKQCENYIRSITYAAVQLLVKEK